MSRRGLFRRRSVLQLFEISRYKNAAQPLGPGAAGNSSALPVARTLALLPTRHAHTGCQGDPGPRARDCSARPMIPRTAATPAAAGGTGQQGPRRREGVHPPHVMFRRASSRCLPSPQLFELLGLALLRHRRRRLGKKMLVLFRRVRACG